MKEKPEPADKADSKPYAPERQLSCFALHFCAPVGRDNALLVAACMYKLVA